MSKLEQLKGGGANTMEIININDSYLIQGDCLEVMDRLIEMGIKVDAIITDPPYG